MVQSRPGGGGGGDNARVVSGVTGGLLQYLQEVLAKWDNFVKWLAAYDEPEVVHGTHYAQCADLNSGYH